MRLCRFLTDEQSAAYGRFVGDPAQAELERFFLLDDADLAIVAKHRGDHNRLGSRRSWAQCGSWARS